MALFYTDREGQSKFSFQKFEKSASPEVIFTF